MEKVLAPRGTQTSLETLVSDIQTYLHLNYNRLIDFVFDSYGVNAAVNPDGTVKSTDTSLKVTSATSNDLGIEPGDAITSGLNYIGVSSRISIANGDRPEAGTHQLWLRHTHALTAMVDISNGGFYSPGTKQTPSRQHDSNIVTWDTPSISGVWLADVTLTNDGSITSITDTRQSNILKCSPKIIQRSIARLSETDSQTFQGPLLFPAFTLYSGINNLLVTYDTLYDVINTIAPPAPKNFRIVDVSSPTLAKERFRGSDDYLADAVRTGLLSHEAKILLKWNWDDIQGGGKDYYSELGTNQFKINNCSGSRTWTENELINFMLWDPVIDKNYKITANTATSGIFTTLTVIPYQHTTSIEHSTIISSNYGWIHSGAKSYEIVATPVTEGNVKDTESQIEVSIHAESNPIAIHKTFQLLLGSRYDIKIRSVGPTKTSAYTVLAPGSYAKLPPHTTTNAYDSPYLVRIPNINSTGAKVGATTTPTGFTVTVVGWEAATDFEVCYSTDASGADYGNSTHEKFVTRQRAIDVTTNDILTYNVKVRPLISGQAVAAPLEATVNSGTGGRLPNDTGYPITGISLQTFAGQFSTYVASKAAWGITNFRSPCNSADPTNDAATLDNTFVGNVVTAAGVDYIVHSIVGNDHLRLASLDGYAVLPMNANLSGINFTSGESKLSRELYRAENLPTDIQITSVFVEVFSKGGKVEDTAPVLRWYQAGCEQYADSLVLGGRQVAITYTQATDVKILGARGTRSLIVDLWDESGADNYSGFTGNITIYYRPFTTTGRRANVFTSTNWDQFTTLESTQ